MLFMQPRSEKSHGNYVVGWYVVLVFVETENYFIKKLMLQTKCDFILRGAILPIG